MHALIGPERPADVGDDAGRHVPAQPREDAVLAVVVVQVKVLHAQQPVILDPLRGGNRASEGLDACQADMPARVGEGTAAAGTGIASN